jgi:predicted phosphodiesterase
VGGPYPTETIRLLTSVDSVMIRGNNDDYALRLDADQAPEAWRVSKQWAFTRSTTRLLDREAFDCIRELPDQCSLAFPCADPIRVVHGSPRSSTELVFPDRNPDQLAELLTLFEEPVMVCGHTHQPWVCQYNGRLALNPGSVGAPLNGDPRAQYALLDWQDNRWDVEHRVVPYDYERIVAGFDECGLLEEGGALARAAVLTTKTGQDVFQNFLDYAYRMVYASGRGRCETIPDDIWEQAEAMFDWDVCIKDI